MAQPQQNQMTIQQSNAMARAAVLGSAIEMKQQIYSSSITTPGSGGNVVNIVPRNVGLIKYFLVEVQATITNAATTTIAPTSLGIANLLSQIVFTDLNNNTRINTTGWHMNALNSAKGHRVFGSANTTDTKVGYGAGNVANLFLQPTSIAATTTGVVKMLYKIPLAYSDDDLRGAVYANVVNATMNLQLTINPSPIIVSTSDAVLSVYSGATANGSITTASITVYQVYLDQLPVNPQTGPILPVLDLSTIYELKNTALTGATTTQDFPIPYANFRDFLSTTVIYDNGGTLNTGSDVTYVALQSANFTNIFKLDPELIFYYARDEIKDDFPAGMYYISHRRRPLSTIQYGNLQLIFNPAGTVQSGAQFLVGFEAFALVNSLTGAGSLPAG
jgi:hypothetical protein